MEKIILTFSLVFLLFITANSQVWTPLGTGTNDDIKVLCEYAGELYAGGEFTTAGGNLASYIAKWDGTSWIPLPSNVNGEISDMVVYGGELYVSGRFTSAGSTPANSIAKWNGTTWSAVGSGVVFVSNSADCNALAVYNGALYAGGWFTTAGGVSVNNIAKWDGTNWSSLGSSSGIDGFVYKMVAYNNELYVGGFFNDAAGLTGTANLAKWNGTNWSSLGVGVNDIVYALYTDSLDLYVGGKFSSANGTAVSNIAKWNGTSFSSLGIGTSSSVRSITSHLGSLYIGGNFNLAGGISANNVAKWNGTAWSALGAGLSGTVYALLAYNGELHAGGRFHDPTGVLSGRINAAKWTTVSSTKAVNNNHFSIEIHPNPFSNSIVLSGIKEKTSVCVHDALGKVIGNWAVTKDQTTITTEHLKPGVYFLTLQIGAILTTKKLIKR